MNFVCYNMCVHQWINKRRRHQWKCFSFQHKHRELFRIIYVKIIQGLYSLFGCFFLLMLLVVNHNNIFVPQWISEISGEILEEKRERGKGGSKGFSKRKDTSYRQFWRYKRKLLWFCDTRIIHNDVKRHSHTRHKFSKWIFHSLEIISVTKNREVFLVCCFNLNFTLPHFCWQSTPMCIMFNFHLNAFHFHTA